MATLTIVKQGVVGDHRYCVADYTGPSSYATGGDEINPEDLGFARTIYFLNAVSSTATAANVRIFAFDNTNEKLVIYTDIDTAAEAANASDQDAVTARIYAEGY